MAFQFGRLVQSMAFITDAVILLRVGKLQLLVQKCSLQNCVSTLISPGMLDKEIYISNKTDHKRH